jgi:hypothetical protein
MEIWLLIAFIASLAVMNYRLAHSVLYPPFIFCFMWVFVLVVYQLNLIEVDVLHLNTSIVGLGRIGLLAWRGHRVPDS